MAVCGRNVWTLLVHDQYSMFKRVDIVRSKAPLIWRCDRLSAVALAGGRAHPLTRRCYAGSSQALGALNTLPLELQAMQTNATTPVIYALGTLTTALSLVVIGTSLSVLWWLRARQAAKGSDAGKGIV